MSLIQCPECAREISDKAPACPHCGVPIQAATPPPIPQATMLEPPKEKSNAWKYLLLIAGAIFGLAIISALVDGTKSPTASPATGPQAAPAIDAKALADFEEALAAVKAEGGFTSIEIVGTDQAWISVAKPFEGMTFENKRYLMAMVYAVYHARQPSVSFIVIKDAYSNKTIGKYSPTYDLKLE